MGFTERVHQAVLLFRERVHSGPVLVVGNLDTDGITGTSILVQTLLHEGIPFGVHIIKQLSDPFLNELRETAYPVIFFADLGSGYLTGIERALQGKHVFIFDHHHPERWETPEWIVHVNPHLDGIDGTKDVSAAGVCYFFARTLRPEHVNLAHLALIGAVGDIQEHFGFSGLNKEILRDALHSGVLELREGLRMFGLYTKPLCKVFEYSTSPYLPGVTGNRDGAIRFLEESGIAPSGKGGTLRFTDLKPDTAQRLMTLLKEKTADPSIGPVYLLPHEGDNTPFRDVKEFSTVLNSCGRMGKTGLGVGVCLNDGPSRKEALELLQDYRREIIRGLEWFYAHRGTPYVIEQKGFTLINAEGVVRDTLIGTIASLLSKSHLYPDNTIIMSMAHTLGGETKVSTRLCGFQPSSQIDLRLVIKELVEKSGGYGGGHRLAAGATIPQDKEQLFLTSALEVLSRVITKEPVLA